MTVAMAHLKGSMQDHLLDFFFFLCVFFAFFLLPEWHFEDPVVLS